jgi:hypothetical protein
MRSHCPGRLVAALLVYLVAAGGCGNGDGEGPAVTVPGDPKRASVHVADKPAGGERPVAVAAQTERGQAVYVDGKQVGERYDQVFGLTIGPAGKTVAFAARSGKQSFIVKNGRRLGGEYDFVDEPVLSPDGSRVASIVRDGTKSLLTVDGRQVGAAYDGEVTEPVFLPDGKSVAYAVHEPDAGRAFVMKGEQQVGDQYDQVSRLTVSPKSESLVFVARSGNEAFLVKDGVQWGPSYSLGSMGWIQSLTFSPDGKSVAFVVVDGSGPQVVKDFQRQSGQYRSVGPLALGESGDPFVYACRQEETWFLMWNGERRQLAPGAKEVRHLVLDRSGRSAACWVHLDKGWYVNKAGTNVFGPVDRPVKLTRTPTDKLLAVGLSNRQVRRKTLAW